MNWQDVKWPLETWCVDCYYDQESGDDEIECCNHDDAETYYTIDGNWDHIAPRDVNNIANALLAEVERLRATQRKLAKFVWLYNFKNDFVKQAAVGAINAEEAEAYNFNMRLMDELLVDPDVQAAIKEAEK